MDETAGSARFPKHFDGERFYNPDAPQARGPLDFLRWTLNSQREPPGDIVEVQPSVPPQRVGGRELRVTLVNHSTVLAQQSTANILTDPIWSERASPFSWVGPRRMRKPGVRQEDLPPVDLVLISHNHYDHLDLPTLRWLARRGGSVFLTPRGVAGLLRSAEIQPVYELDWGEARTFGKTTVHCVPALHFSARGIFDRNKTLWCGYVIEAQNRLLYFAGDTGFGEHFSLIRKNFGAPFLAFLPIGAFEPRWFMSPIHMGPEDAVRAHRILGAGASIAIHHGTFQLGDDGIDTPKERLLSFGRPDSFVILENGQFTSFA